MVVRGYDKPPETETISIFPRFRDVKLYHSNDCLLMLGYMYVYTLV